MGRFFRRGESKILFLPTWASANPSSGEISAGTDLTTGLSNITGWDFANTPITTPDLSTTFDTQIGVQNYTYEFAVKDEAFCARLRGWLAGAVELTGGKNAVVTESKCACRGQDHCVFAVSWDA